MALECHVQWMNPSMINEYLMSGARGVWRSSVVRGKRVHGDTKETSRDSREIERRQKFLV